MCVCFCFNHSYTGILVSGVINSAFGLHLYDFLVDICDEGYKKIHLSEPLQQIKHEINQQIKWKFPRLDFQQNIEPKRCLF